MSSRSLIVLRYSIAAICLFAVVASGILRVLGPMSPMSELGRPEVGALTPNGFESVAVSALMIGFPLLLVVPFRTPWRAVTILLTGLYLIELFASGLAITRTLVAVVSNSPPGSSRFVFAFFLAGCWVLLLTRAAEAKRALRPKGL